MSTTKLKSTVWSWRDAQYLRIFAALAEDSNSIPKTYVMRLTTASNSSSRGSGAPLRLLKAVYLCAYTHIQTHIHTTTSKINLKRKIKPPITPVIHKMSFPQDHIKLVTLSWKRTTRDSVQPKGLGGLDVTPFQQNFQKVSVFVWKKNHKADILQLN